MIETLEKDLADAQAVRKRLIDAAEASEKNVLDRRFYDGYITALKYALVVVKHAQRNEALNPFTKGVERCQ